MFNWIKNLFKSPEVTYVISLEDIFPQEELPKKQAPAKKTTPRKKTMPLKKSISKEAFKANVKAEVKAGKKPDQAVAIAYSVKREAAKKTTKGKK